MRFKAAIHNVNSFIKLAASLASLGNVAWVRLNNDEVRFTIIPEQGTQVWAVLSIDSLFETYTIQSAAINNTINLEVPLGPFLRALRSASDATSVSIRLTKENGIPLLRLTVVTTSFHSGGNDFNVATTTEDEYDEDAEALDATFGGGGQDRETLITQDVPIIVLTADQVEDLHEPRSREPDVHIMLPPLQQLKSISDRFTRLSVTTKAGLAGPVSTQSAKASKLEISANMHGCLRLGIRNDAMNISSVWTGLMNPELDPAVVPGGEEGIREHPSTRMKELGDADGRRDEGWARVRVDGKDWSRVLSVGRLGGRVIACFCHEHALILYVYLSNDDDGGDESVLTYYISSYSQ